MFRDMRFVGAAFAFALASQAALAGGDFVTVRRVAVPYGDLDLGSAAGRDALAGRVDAATLKACGSNPVISVNYQLASRFVRADFAKCRNAAAVEAAVTLKQRGIHLAAAN